MEPIRSLKQLEAHLRDACRQWHVAVVCADDDHTTEAVARAANEGIARFTLFGTKSPLLTRPELAAHKAIIDFVATESPEAAAREAVDMVRRGEADILMKGLLNTDILLRAVLNKQSGLLPTGELLTHLALADSPDYDRLLLFSDAAVIPNPTLAQRVKIIEYAVNHCRKFGVEEPHVALIHCTEKVSAKFPISLEYGQIVEMAHNGRFGRAVVDGPMDVRTACDKSSAETKGMTSPVCGQADILIMPDIQAGNIFYKTLSTFSQTEMAGMLMGTMRPVVLTSRSDSALSKYHSLLMACITGTD